MLHGGKLTRMMEEDAVTGVTSNPSIFQKALSEHEIVTWDCHSDGYCHNASFADYRDTLGPAFDQAFATLLEDLGESGLLDSTLVVAAGEFGRTPRINDRGGRDHWPAVWSILLAGGGIRGGEVVGASDPRGAEPRDRAMHAREVFGTVLGALGVNAGTAAR